MIVSPFVYIFDIISLLAAESEKPKIGFSGKGLTSNEKQVPKSYTKLSRLYFLGTTTVQVPDVLVIENAKVDTQSWESNSGPYDCQADALPHNHGHHKFRSK